MKTFPRTEFGDPVLRRRAKPVPLALIRKPGFQKFLKQMFFTMHRADGVGLAAPQVGLSLQLAVVEVKDERRKKNGKRQKTKKGLARRSLGEGGERIVLINPKVVRVSKEKSYDWEGCLSLVGVRGRVPRPRKIAVRYTTETGEVRERKLSGFLARVFQHEIDHLNGALFVDRMEDMQTLMTVAELRKRLARKK